MARNKVPGIYMIRNNINGLIYIGESKDIRTRWSKYKWAVNSTSNYKETKRQLVLDMRKYGIENFEFTILDSSDSMRDKNARLAKEAELISKYNSDDPSIGYNLSPGHEPIIANYDGSREQSTSEKLRRAKPIFEYDTKTGSSILYLGGAKSWGDQYGVPKDIASHTVKRGSLALKRYYLIYADPILREKQLAKIRDAKLNIKSRPRSEVRAANAYYKYEAAVNEVAEAAKYFGFK